MVVALGAIAVLGGKKLWDFLKERQEQKHEQRLEEIKAQKEIASTGHEQCVAKQQALESQVSGLQNKLSDLEEKASVAEKKANDSMSLVDGVGELEGELKKLKKKVKKLEESAPAPKGK
jgi:predicted  nucleic acid-binding Zn-ribbon protein